MFKPTDARFFPRPRVTQWIPRGDAPYERIETFSAPDRQTSDTGQRAQNFVRLRGRSGRTVTLSGGEAQRYLPADGMPPEG
jgi:hypothetical protein